MQIKKRRSGVNNRLEIDCCSYRGMNETSEKFPVKIWVKAKNGEERMYRL